MYALAELLERSGSQAGDVGYLAHGSTVATNAIVQRRLARTALITNRGFRDVLAIGTQMRHGLRPVDAAARADRPARALPRGARAARSQRRGGRAARRGGRARAAAALASGRGGGRRGAPVLVRQPGPRAARRRAPRRGAARRALSLSSRRRPRVPRVRARVDDRAQRRRCCRSMGAYVRRSPSGSPATACACRCTSCSPTAAWRPPPRPASCRSRWPPPARPPA